MAAVAVLKCCGCSEWWCREYGGSVMCDGVAACGADEGQRMSCERCRGRCRRADGLLLKRVKMMVRMLMCADDTGVLMLLRFVVRR